MENKNTEMTTAKKLTGQELKDMIFDIQAKTDLVKDTLFMTTYVLETTSEISKNEKHCSCVTSALYLLQDDLEWMADKLSELWLAV